MYKIIAMLCTKFHVFSCRSFSLTPSLLLCISSGLARILSNSTHFCSNFCNSPRWCWLTGCRWRWWCWWWRWCCCTNNKTLDFWIAKFSPHQSASQPANQPTIPPRQPRRTTSISIKAAAAGNNIESPQCCCTFANITCECISIYLTIYLTIYIYFYLCIHIYLYLYTGWRRDCKLESI